MSHRQLTLDLDSLVEEIEDLLTDRPSSQGAIHKSPNQKNKDLAASSRSSSVPRSGSARNKNNVFANTTAFANHNNSTPSPASKKSAMFKKQFSHNDLELDDFMNELIEDSPTSPIIKRKNSIPKNASVGAFTTSSPVSSLTSPRVSKKCSTTYLSNRHDSFGINTFLTPKRCSDLRCMKCDFKVINFDGKKWKDDVNYLFFRNNYPETVKKGFEEKEFPDHTSYCCQCSWITVSDRTSAKNLTSLNWYCGGHKN